MMCDRLDRKMANVKRILDVGVGTGHPMKQIINRIPSRVRVVGIDIDTNYLRYYYYSYEDMQNRHLNRMIM
jgi:ubiquinone/menaquinone biosynthesis C-methylase UbiE